METRFLLIEGNSIRENKFSCNKEISMEKEFLYKAKFFYERKNVIMKRKFYFEKKIPL